MLTETLFTAAGAIVFVLGLYGLFSLRHLLRQIVAGNVATGGVFLIVLTTARAEPMGEADPVVQALVLTGIVVSVSVTAFALALLRRLVELAGSAELDPEDG